MYTLSFLKHENTKSLRQDKKLTCLFYIIILLGLGLSIKGQEPGTYVVPVKTKTYSRFPTPLIRSGQPIETLVVNGKVYFEGDIYLGTEEEMDRLQNRFVALSVTADENLITARWEGGVVPYVFLGDFTSNQREKIINSMNHIAAKTNVFFKPRTNQSSYIKFKMVTEQELGYEGGHSEIGRCGFCTDGQEIQLTNTRYNTVRHEIGHALGLYHEQSREDRDQHVEILWDNVEFGQQLQFAQANPVATDVGPYDFSSIMHYSAFAFGRMVGGHRLQTIRRRSNPNDTNFGEFTVLSAGDIRGINRMYPTMSGELAVGRSREVTIWANEPYNYTNIYLREGQKFEFSVRSPEWNNGWTVTTASGYSGGVGLRHGSINQMALIGEIFSDNNPLAYTGTYFRIGTGRTWTATKSGKLVAFANDCLPCYWDNSRVVELKVKRTQ